MLLRSSNKKAGESLPSSRESSHDIDKLKGRWLKNDPQKGGTHRDNVLGVLRTSCQKQSNSRPQDMDLRGIDLSGEDLSGLDLSYYDLRGADLEGSNLSESNLSWCELQSASLCKAQLTGCELLGANLEGANLNECFAKNAGFGAANLSDATLISAELQDATISEASLLRADLRTADLTGSSIRNSDLTETNFTRANLRKTDLKQSNVQGAIFHVADLQDARLLGLKNYTKAMWVGADIRGVDLRGAYMVRRYIRDENYLFEFKTRSKYNSFLYWVWWLTSDCGRSFSRWTLSIAVVTFVFALLFSLVEVDYGAYETPFSPFYYSVVTLTTLGYGDVLPASLAAQIIAALESILGYVGLGGLLSILSNKIARRAD